MDLVAVLAAMGLTITNTFSAPPLAHKWLLLNDKYWMIDTGNPIPAPEMTRCGANMIEIEGEKLLDPESNPWGSKTIDALQKSTCLEWIERKTPLDKCKRYDKNKWFSIVKRLRTKHMHFCIDKFEAPNVAGQDQIIMVNLNEAQQICNNQGKRLPTEDEWEFACEGEEGIPYGYGYERDATVCVIDKQWKPYHESSFYPRTTERLARELDWLWQGEPSGSRLKCHSIFNVFDLTGSVDEITISTRPGTSKLSLRGGYWVPVRTRCHVSTRSHNEFHTFYQESFRCAKSLNNLK